MLGTDQTNGILGKLFTILVRKMYQTGERLVLSWNCHAS